MSDYIYLVLVAPSRVDVDLLEMGVNVVDVEQVDGGRLGPAIDGDAICVLRQKGENRAQSTDLQSHDFALK